MEHILNSESKHYLTLESLVTYGKWNTFLTVHPNITLHFKA